MLDKKDMSQRDLSRATGIRAATISMYCNNTIKRMNKEDIDKICRALKISISELIEYKD